MWVSDKRVELDVISLDAGDISLIIQWYEQITGISLSYLVYILNYNNPAQVKSHTQLLHGKISMPKIYVTTERHTYAGNKRMSPLESLHGHYLQWKLNGGK